MIVVLWGVSGCGKTTVGQLLAQRLGGNFFDADDFHPQENIEKMRVGIPLNDNDRWPWLTRLAELLESKAQDGGTTVLACSALKSAYRDRLTTDPERTYFVQLVGSFDLIAARLAKREHAFMNNELLRSQFDALEQTTTDRVVDINQSPEAICDAIAESLEQT